MLIVIIVPLLTVVLLEFTLLLIFVEVFLVIISIHIVFVVAVVNAARSSLVVGRTGTFLKDPIIFLTLPCRDIRLDLLFFKYFVCILLGLIFGKLFVNLLIAL